MKMRKLDDKETQFFNPNRNWCNPVSPPCDDGDSMAVRIHHATNVSFRVIGISSLNI